MRVHRSGGLLLLACLAVSALAADPAREAISEFRRLFSPGMNTLTRTNALAKVAQVTHRDVLPALVWALELTVRAVERRTDERADEAKKLTKLEDQLAAISQRAVEAARKRGEPPPRTFQVPLSLKMAAEEARARVESLQKEIDAEYAMRSRVADTLGRWLGGLPDDLAADVLTTIVRKGLRSRDPDERRFYIRALGAAPRDGPRRILADLLETERNRTLLPAIVDALARQAGEDAIAALLPALASERWQVRAAVVAAFARVGSPEAIQILIDRLRIEEGRLRGDIALALRILTGENLGYGAERWQTWWDAHREGFVPPRDRKPEEEEEEPAGDGAKEGSSGPKPKPEPTPEDRPSFYGIEILSKRVVFVIDISGSMNEPATQYEKDRTKIWVAKRELKNAVLALPDDAHFNIIPYAAEVSVWRKGMIKSKRAERLAAAKFVEKMTADGGTNIHDALERAFKIAGRGARDKKYDLGADTIILLSDGQPTRGNITDPDQILAEVKRWNVLRRVKIHTVGVGNEHNESFMRGLAESSGGTYVKR
jgi:HEAT repeat protein